MKSHRVVGFALAILLVSGLGAAKKERDWKTGTLTEEAEEREVAGSTATNAVGAYGAPAMNNQAVVYATRVGYVIKGADMGFMVELRVLPSTILRHSRRPSVTIHGPIKYAYEKGKFYLQDEQGQEFEMTIMRKEALPAPPATAPPAAAVQPK